MIEIKADRISKNFGNRPVFSDLSFHYTASVLGIAGSNGAGKSTFLRILSGLIKPSSGSVTWSVDGNNFDAKKVKPYLGYAAPYIQLYEELTVYENLTFLKELQENSIPVTINDILYRFEASGFRDSLYGKLSTGQQQRVKLAAAVIKDPHILMLDEPGSNLDEKGRALVKRMADDYRQTKRMLIIASNQPDELALCDETIDLNSH
jgi:ABC-type multidrug transport system ATPase subunit